MMCSYNIVSITSQVNLLVLGLGLPTSVGHFLGNNELGVTAQLSLGHNKVNVC